MQILLAALVAFCPAQDGAELRRRLKDPAQVWPVFREFLAAGQYAKAHLMLSEEARRRVPYEQFFLFFTAFEAPRRMVETTDAHGVETSDASAATVRLCGAEFGLFRDVRLVMFQKLMWVLDLTGEDIEYLKGRALGWYRHQVRKADGWHFAYPPDWTYAPVARTCVCGK